MEGEEEQLLANIRSVPSNVDLLEPLQKFSKKAVKIIIRKRLKERENEGFKDQMEDLRTLNLISILYASTGKTDEAVRYNDMALEINDRNVNALACKAWYLLQDHDYYNSETYNETLNEEKKNPLAILVSKAEIAFAYSKLGMDMYPRAEKLFTEVLEKSRQNHVPEYYICNWKFSLAQTIRRQLDVHNTHDLTAFNDRKHRLQRVFELFFEIDDVSDESVKPVRAKTLAELGLLIEKLNHAGEQLNELTQDVRVNDPKYCFEKALELQPDSVFVLERSGTYFRLIDDVDRSLLCLKKALQINNVRSYAHHHIALALVLQLNKQLEQSNSKLRVNLDEKEERFESGFVYFEHDRCYDIVDRMETTNISLKAGSTSSGALHSSSLTVLRNDEPQESEVDSVDNDLHRRSIVETDPCSMSKYEKQYPSEEIDEIIFHLDKSYELNNNLIALLQKGVLLRITGQYEKARAVFKSMFNDRTCSLVYLANAYEKAAICNLIIKNQTHDSSKRRFLEHDAKIYLRKTIEISCKLIARDPSLSSLYVAFPTLKSMLLGQSESSNVRNLREMGNLSRKLMNYSDALGLFKKALELERGEEEQKRVLMDVVKLCLQSNAYDDAIVHLKMIGCLPHASDKIDSQVYITAHIKGALLSWSKGEKEMARQRIEDVISYVSVEKASANSDGSEKLVSECVVHVCVLSSEASEDRARKLSDLLQDIGLRATLNSEDVMPGSLEKIAMLKIVERSKHVALFLGKEETENDLQWLQFIVSERYEKVTVITEPNTTISYAVFNRFPRLWYTDAVFGDACFIHEDRLSWVEEFLFMVADTKPVDLSIQ